MRRDSKGRFLPKKRSKRSKARSSKKRLISFKTSTGKTIKFRAKK